MTDAAPSRLKLPAHTLRLSLPVGQLAQGGLHLVRKLGLGAPSDRRLRTALDLPVLDRAPADLTAAAVAAEVGAMTGTGDWSGVHALIHEWDMTRAATPQGARKARIAAHALIGAEAAEAFAARAAAAPQDPVAAALAALALLRGGHDPEQAARWIDPFEPAAMASPLLAEAHYRLARAWPQGGHDLDDAHDDWADLDPADAAVWETHAAQLIRSSEGDLAPLAAAAERAEWQTERWLGKGGYALFLLPVLPAAPAVWNRIDPERLAAAMLDLARHRHKDQGAVNRIAADWARLGETAPAPLRPLLRTSYRQLLEECLNTLVPAAWDLPEAQARRRIAEAFLPELRIGACLRATPAGLRLCDPSAA
ncbi:MAG: hypothetical protein ACK4S2_01015 [Gemmobacter sp.]|uniref:hypothetical protein n=1 Tax=Gemmobacter sp. TaxID=1898957 RepID=UPI00391BA026